MRWILCFGIFLTGIVVGVFVMQAGAAQQEKLAGLRLNHFGISVKNVNESMKFYTKTMGFREAFSVKDKRGNQVLIYLQISRDTFLELAPADADHPVGFTHAGLWADDLKGAVTALRRQGVKVDDPIVGATKASLTNVIDPNGVRLELLEFTPESLQRKAIQAWR
jgi:catechol 2,3-dioxygenase-like lactoylglutathione lyase family enzyme